MSERIAHRAALLHFIADPQTHGDTAWEYFPDGVLLVEGGRVLTVGPADALLPQIGDTPVIHHDNAMLVPGFVDTHVHFPQANIIASFGASLLEWLERYAFPAEAAFADVAHCQAMADFFLDALLANGTTSALVFATVHAESADALFRAAAMRRLRIAAGKVMMNRNAPEALLDTTESAVIDSRRLIEKWHGRERLAYAVTPRFAITSDDAQLAAAGRLLAEHAGVLLHTHLSENTDELEQVRVLFPTAKNYLDVYDRHGLVGARSVFAHAIHLDDDEWRVLTAAGAAVAFCPSSNFFLGSGLFNTVAARHACARVALGSDIGGGTSFSMLRVIDEAYKCARLRGDTVYPEQLWYWASLGGARALHWEDCIGNFAEGKEADFLVLDLAATPLIARRVKSAITLSEKLLALAVLGDDRLVRQTYILGEPCGVNGI